MLRAETTRQTSDRTDGILRPTATEKMCDWSWYWSQRNEYLSRSGRHKHLHSIASFGQKRRDIYCVQKRRDRHQSFSTNFETEAGQSRYFPIAFRFQRSWGLYRKETESCGHGLVQSDFWALNFEQRRAGRHKKKVVLFLNQKIEDIDLKRGKESTHEAMLLVFEKRPTAQTLDALLLF